MLVAAAAELLSVSMESAGLVYLKSNNPWSLILLAGHITLDILFCACLHPILFVALSSAGPLVALMIAREPISMAKAVGVVLVIGGVIASAMLISPATQMCCTPNYDLTSVLVSGMTAAALMAWNIYRELLPVRTFVFRIIFIACISMIATLNLIAMETIAHCNRPGLAAACVALTMLEIFCVKQSLRVSRLTSHIPSQFGGLVVQSFFFYRQPLLPLLAPMIVTLWGIYLLTKD